MAHIFLKLILLCLNQHSILMLHTPRLIGNKSFNIEEYGTIKFDCLIEQCLLAAWRISLRHDNIYRYYYTNPNLRNQFLEANENEDKPRDVIFENHMRTMIFHNVRQWINSAFENIECVIYNNKTNIYERMIYYLNIYVSPSSFSLNMNHIPMTDQSIFWFDDKQQVKIFCEIYSYPKSTLQFQLNNQSIQSNETIDCLNDDLSTILLSNSLCLSQTNWRIRVRISRTINLSEKYNKQNLTCSVIDFPYGNSWKYSTGIQFIEIKEISTKLSTSSISSFLNSRITEQTLINSVFVTFSTTTIRQSETFSQENRHLQLSFLFIFVVILFIIFAYLFYKNNRRKVFHLTNSIKPV